MTNWQPPPSWQNDAARRAQAAAQQANAQMSEQARRFAQEAGRYRPSSRRARRRHPFIRFVVILAFLAAAAYVGYLVLTASGKLPSH